ncbi:MAG: site-2 protease family protein [Candidatus Schekmanbacteria bacterium]|nr:MAG: site-2 protease family protein [Candidatus Schekmanbacteria bacterium]
MKKSFIHLILLIATICTTLFMGAFFEGGNPLERIGDIWLGLPYSLTLLTILGAHEYGHYRMCRKHLVPATLPYFIPAPPPFILGTFGAVIKIKARMPDRKALFDVGITGPILGLIIAIPACIIGVATSNVVPVTGEEGIVLGDSLLFSLIVYLIKGPLPDGYDLMLNSVAFAGWFGLLVTAFNLLPSGQLDGGHIIYAVLGEKAEILGKVVLFILIILGLFWPGWFFWSILLVVLGFKHPPPLNDYIPLDSKRKMMALLILIVFILTFIPVPIEIR